MLLLGSNHPLSLVIYWARHSRVFSQEGICSIWTREVQKLSDPFTSGCLFLWEYLWQSNLSGELKLLLGLLTAALYKLWRHRETGQFNCWWHGNRLIFCGLHTFCQTKPCRLNEFFLESSRTCKDNNSKIGQRPICTRCYKTDKCWRHFFRTYALIVCK